MADGCGGFGINYLGLCRVNKVNIIHITHVHEAPGECKNEAYY